MNKHTAELLEQHFDTAFSAANGIQKLRELILTLAMQGKLVPQEPKDAPTSQLRKEIETEKKRLVKEGKIKAPKPLPVISSSDEPYALPQGWQWVRLGSVGNIFNGNSINATEKEAKYAGAKGLPYIATKDVGYGFDPLDYENGICIPVGEDKFRVAREGAVLICAEGGSAGKKCGLTDRDICFGNKLFANELYGQIPTRFILYIYLSPVFRASFASAMSGIIGGVSIAKFVEIPIPLPPLDEQHRIIAKIDQLMARCDALENLRNEREQKRLATHAAALSQLLDTTGNGSADDAWDFISQNFGDLYAVKENVTELRKAILQLAVMGKLTPQDPNDAPASQLLKVIEAKKKQLLKEGRIKAAKPLPEISLDEVPHALPESWEWVRLGSVAEIIGGFAYKSNLFKVDGTHQVLRLGNIRPNLVRVDENPVYIDEDLASQTDDFRVVENDILITMTGTREKRDYLYSVLVEQNPLNGKHLYLNQRVGAIRTYVLPRYFDKVLKVEGLKDAIYSTATGSANQANIGISSLREWMLPVPPLPEQRRIVTKVDLLMSLCDRLEKCIESAAIRQSELLSAVMAEV